MKKTKKSSFMIQIVKIQMSFWENLIWKKNSKKRKMEKMGNKIQKQVKKNEHYKNNPKL